MKWVVLSSILLIFICASCSKKNLGNSKKKESKSESNMVNQYSFKKCESSETCPGVFDCYYTFLLYDHLFEYQNLNQTWNYFNLDSLLKCTFLIYENNSDLKLIAEECLYSFYNKMFLAAKKSGRPVSPLKGIHYNILINWNTIRSFELCLQFFSMNDHDSMGHGDCTNLSIEFFNRIILPKIKTIEGMDFWTYFDKHNHGNHGPADCYDSMYEALYPMLKKAWEEGKIVLKTNE
ncbi:MAG: hypothetical protein H6567_05345 [Lewinellaceae bacterium]|nr:hypothetical protein [Lewinellaceae bacterium]